MMNIEKFIDTFGDDVYALALVCTKNFDSAADIFTAVAEECEELSDSTEMYELAVKVYSLCRTAKCSDNAETLSQIGLSKKQELLLSGFFPKPLFTRAAVHMYFENDLSVEQIAEVLGEKPRYVSEQLDDLGTELYSDLEDLYKELCVKISAPDELKADAIKSAKSGEKRVFEILDDPIPKHTWTKNQKIAAIILAVIVTIALMIVIPIVNQLIDGYFMAESQEEVPSDLIFSYTSETEHTPSV